MYEKLLVACNKRGIYPGIHCGVPAYAVRMINMGVRLTTIANDSGLMAQGRARGGRRGVVGGRQFSLGTATRPAVRKPEILPPQGSAINPPSRRCLTPEPAGPRRKPPLVKPVAKGAAPRWLERADGEQSARRPCRYRATLAASRVYGWLMDSDTAERRRGVGRARRARRDRRGGRHRAVCLYPDPAADGRGAGAQQLGSRLDRLGQFPRLSDRRARRGDADPAGVAPRNGCSARWR